MDYNKHKNLKKRNLWIRFSVIREQNNNSIKKLSCVSGKVIAMHLNVGLQV